jgi:S1-C subfamily serine protease
MNPQDGTRRDRISGPGTSAQSPRDLSRDFNFGGQFRAGEGGLTVSTVAEDGFFHNAGVLEGDRIMSVNGQEVASEADFRRLMMAGEGRFPVIVMRNGERQEIFVNAADIAPGGRAVGGTETSPGERKRAALGLWFYHTRHGAHVTRVVPDSPAQRAGVQVGDFVVRINDVPYRDWRAASSQVTEAEPESMLTLHVWRDGRTIPLEAQLGAYYEVYSDPNETWDNVAAPQAAGGINGATRAGAASPDLEQRVRQLERDMAELRQRLDDRANSTSPPPQSDNGQRTSAPRDGQ